MDTAELSAAIKQEKTEQQNEPSLPVKHKQNSLINRKEINHDRRIWQVLKLHTTQGSYL
jgi:hypothetical protein